MIRRFVEFLSNQARERLDNGRRIGFAEYGQDQMVYPAVPAWRWYHWTALSLEQRWYHWTPAGLRRNL